MSSDIEHFDDPRLKRAIKKVYGEDAASEQLRQRIRCMLAQEHRAAAVLPAVSTGTDKRSQSLRPFRMHLWSQPLFGLAALFLVAAGAGLYAIEKHYSGGMATVSRATLVAMVQTHDRCCQAPAHTMEGLPQSDMRAIGRAMRARLHGSVLAADLARDGWTFSGAAMCSVGGKLSAHLVFTRDGQRVSVFSLPATACGASGQGRMTPECVDGHMVAGFVKSGGAFCMVGYCRKNKLSLDEVASLLDSHRDEVLAETESVAHAANAEVQHAVH